MKSKLDWKGVGQFVAVLVKAITTITATMKEIGVGIEILEWINGSGKTRFVELLKELGVSYKKCLPTSPPNRKGPHVIHRTIINLSVNPKLPFDGAKMTKNTPGDPNAVIELWSDDKLRIDGVEIILHLEPGQKGGLMKWTALKEALSGKSVQNAALFDFLIANQHFIPNHWKVNEDGRTRYIFFWGTEFSDSAGDLYVRYLYWDVSGWDRGYRWLVHGWGGNSSAAVSAS